MPTTEISVAGREARSFPVEEKKRRARNRERFIRFFSVFSAEFWAIFDDLRAFNVEFWGKFHKISCFSDVILDFPTNFSGNYCRIFLRIIWRDFDVSDGLILRFAGDFSVFCRDMLRGPCAERGVRA